MKGKNHCDFGSEEIISNIFSQKINPNQRMYHFKNWPFVGRDLDDTPKRAIPWYYDHYLSIID